MGETTKGGGMAPMSEKRGDEAPPGTPGTGEDVCEECQGSGTLSGKPCQNCNGTGVVIKGIGGG